MYAFYYIATECLLLPENIGVYDTSCNAYQHVCILKHEFFLEDSKINYRSRVDYLFQIESVLSRAIFLWGNIDYVTMHSESSKLVILYILSIDNRNLAVSFNTVRCIHEKNQCLIVRVSKEGLSEIKKETSITILQVRFFFMRCEIISLKTANVISVNFS